MASHKPGEVARPAESDRGWFAFEPKDDTYLASAGFDLRSLNENEAGDEGFIAVKNGEFVHCKTGKAVRFWGVNGPPDIKDPAQLRRCARLLAKHGVNLVRILWPGLQRRRRNRPGQGRTRDRHRRGDEVRGHLHRYFALLVSDDLAEAEHSVARRL